MPPRDSRTVSDVGRERKRKKPPPKPVSAQARRFGADVGLFTPPALVRPRPAVVGERHKLPPPEPRFGLAQTAQEQRREREAAKAAKQAQRTRDALKAPVDLGARIRVRRGETPAERKVRTTVIQPPRLADMTPRATVDVAGAARRAARATVGYLGDLAERGFSQLPGQPGYRPGATGIGAVDTMIRTGEVMAASGREVSRGANVLAERGVEPLENVIEPILQAINDGLGLITRAPDLQVGRSGFQMAPMQAGGVPDEIVKNFATGLATTIAGAPAGALMLATNPGQVWRETKRQYADYYGPLFRGDFAEFQRMMSEQPVQVVFDVWAALTLGLGAAARGVAIKQTIGATPQQLANVRRGEAIARALLFRQAPYEVQGVGPVFGRKPTIRYEDFKNAAGETARVQRMVPQSAAGTRISDVLHSVRAATGGRGSRGEKLVREEYEQRAARSRAELATFAQRINDYEPSILDRVAATLGIAGTGRRGRTAKALEASRVDAARALAMALDRAGIHGGTLPNVREKIQTEIVQRQNRMIEPGGGGELQARRIRDLVLARNLLDRYIENPETPDALRFMDDLAATRQLAQDTEQKLIDAGILSADTAQNMIDRQTRDVERIETVQYSEKRAQLEDALYQLWGDAPQTISTALQLLDAQALSFERRTGGDAADFYDDAIRKIRVGDVPEGALQQIANFEYSPSPEVAAKNLRSKLDPKNRAKVFQKNKAIRRGGIVIAGKVTPKEWVKRVEAMYPDPLERDTMARWYEIFEPLFRETFGPDADMVMRGFAVSQANASPTFGIVATLKVMDKVRRGEKVRPDEISVVVEGIESAVKGEPILKGMAAKLRDFSDSLAGKTTRTHMGDHPDGGPPVAVDIHAARDLGYIDKRIVERLDRIYGLKQGVHYEIDSTGAPGGVMYERLAEQYVEITNHLNDVGFDGRRDWTPAQVQALGWGTAQKILGVDPEDLGYALGRNTRSIDFEITGGPEELGAGLTAEQILAVQREFESAARDVAASVPGIWVRGVEHEVGGWGGLASPYMSVKVIGSRDAVQAATTKIAQAFRQGLVQASRAVTNRRSKAAVVIDSPAFSDPGVKLAFFQRLYEIEPRLQGAMAGDANGNPALVIRTTSSNVSPKTANDFLGRYRDAVEKVEAEMGIDVGLSARNIELLIGDQYGEASRFATAGRDRWSAGGVDDPLAVDVGERLAAALERAGAGDPDAGRFTPRVLTRDEAWDAPPRPGFVYHGTSEAAARSILEQRRVEVGTRSDPPGAWFAENPALAAFHGDVVLEIPETAMMRSLPLGVRVSDQPVLFQWDYPRWYNTDPRPPRGGALVRPDGTEIILGRDADLTTVVHEAAHAFLPEQLGWLADFDPEWAETVAQRLKMEGDTIDTRAQEIYAYSVEAWAAMGRPTVTQLRDRFDFYRRSSREIYGGKVRIPDEYRKFVSDALEDPSYVAWITEMFDPLYGMRAQDGAFFISRRTPLARNPLARLLQKAGISKPRDRLHARSGRLEEQARDVIGPSNVLANAERWQRFFEQQAKLDEIRTSGHAVPVPVVNGFYDFSSPPEGHIIFNPDGLRGWSRHESEAMARALDDIEASVSLDDADFPDLPIELAERIHNASTDIANRVFPTTGFSADPGEGSLYYLPAWYKDALTRDMSGGLLNSAVIGKGMENVASFLKTLNALQRLRMYLALRYVVLNVGATFTLNTMHQGLFMPFNLGRAVRMAHSHPDHLARVEAEVGSGFYEALTAGELARGAPGLAQLVERTAQAVGHVVSRPEAFLRATSMIHHMHRAGFRTLEQQRRLLDAAKVPGEAREILNQMARWAEEDVVRFRGLPAAERDLLRAVFFVSGWLIAASRFAIRYPANHPFWTTMLAQLGDDGWEEMRRRIAEWTQQTKYSLEVGKGERGGAAYSAQTDLGQWLPFGTASDVTGSILSLPGLNAITGLNPDTERSLLENLGAGGKFVYFLMTGESVYGTPYTLTTAIDDFFISGTPLDYIADVFPGAFRALNHQRTPSKLRLDQNMQEYALEFAFGRAYPNKYLRDEIEARWSQAQKAGGAVAARRAREWADKVEAFHGSPPDEASVAAKVALYEWQSEWARKRDDVQSESDKLVLEADIKARIMKKYGWIPDDFVYRADSAEELHSFVQTDWDNTVVTANEDANAQWSVPKETE